MASKVIGLESFDAELNALLQMVESQAVVDAVMDGWNIVTDAMISRLQFYLSEARQ